MNKRAWLRFCSLAIVVCLLVCSMAGCSKSKDTTAIEQRVQDFVVKCNNLDIDGILRCIDPAISEPVAIAISAMEVFGNFGGAEIDKYKMFEELTNVLLDEEGLDAMEFFESIQVEIVETELDGNYAYVYSNITYAIADIKFTKEGVIYMTEQADVWYVSWLEFGMFE